MEVLIPKKFSLEEQKAKYKNAYKPWTIEEDMKFETLRIAGASVAELALMFDRNKGAISSRLRKFGLQKLK